MIPRIVYSPLSHEWYVVTRYTEKVSASGAKYIIASKKFDVTDQMHAILSKTGRAAVKRGKPIRVEI